jgi:serine/threonine-protein kinase
MRRVEGGAYRIGDRPSRGGPSAFEPREVEVASFWIDELEVANREYAEFVRDSGHPPPPDWPEGTCPPEKLDLPVVYVSWEDARAFAEWAGKRLPTDVEWEVACRGKESKRYPWGNDFDPGRANLPLTGTEMPQAGAREIPPAPLIPGGRMLGDRSDWGVMDLIGNVREWTWSPWTPRADADFEITPELRRPGERAIRGSSFYGPPLPKGCACTNRESLPPHDRDDHTGIRCAKSVDPLADIP